MSDINDFTSQYNMQIIIGTKRRRKVHVANKSLNTDEFEVIIWLNADR